jgi:hypothetical protein
MLEFIASEVLDALANQATDKQSAAALAIAFTNETVMYDAQYEYLQEWYSPDDVMTFVYQYILERIA